VMHNGRLSGPSGARRATPSMVAALTIGAVLSAGLAWLVSDIFQGMRSGRESDLHRRWIVSQYVRAGVNPYPLALAALHQTFGPLGGGRDKPRVYAIPRLAANDSAVDASAGSLLEAHGTPEAVYPPSADLLLTLSLGVLPEKYVHLAGMLFNGALLAVFVVLLCRLQTGSVPGLPAVFACLALVLAWSPTHSAVIAGQFSILVAVCLLLAFECLDRHEWLSGVCLGLALIKPSMALPFLIFPLVRGRWAALAIAAGLHLSAIAVQSVRFGVAPWDLLLQWTGVAGYFTQGQFTLQEVLCAFHLAETPLDFALVGGFILLALGWCLENRDAANAPLIDLLCFVSILWTYHGPYDFVVLLVPLSRRLVPAKSVSLIERGWWRSVIPAAAFFACISLAASPLVYGDEVHFATRLLRHAARLLLALGYASLALEVWRSAKAEKDRRKSVHITEWSASGHDLVKLPA
jgi:hypothetical protein